MISRRSRLPLSVAVAAGLLLGALPALPAQAADVVQPVVDVATAPGDPGVLVVTASSDSDVTGVVAEVRLPEDPGGAPVRTATLSRGEDGLWRSSRLVLQNYRWYDVAVTATDADGDSNTEPGTLQLRYIKQPVVAEHTLTPSALDADHRVIRATGRLELFDPRTGTRSPAVGERVSLTVNSTGRDALTDGSGAYELTDTPWLQNTPGPLTVQVAWSSVADTLTTANPTGNIDQVDLPVVTSPGRIVLDPVPATVRYPATVTISGTLQRQVGAAWQPVQGGEIQGVGQVLSDQPAQETTADGRFSFTFRPADDGSYGVRLAGDSELVAYIGNQSASKQITVVDRTTLHWYGARINEWSELNIQGWLETSSGRNAAKGSKIYVQQSSDAKRWTTLGYVTTDATGRFDVDGYVERPSGYFRLLYLGSTVLQPGPSRTVRLSRIDTRVVGLNAGPEPIRSGRTLRVTGTVQRYTSGAWRAMPKGQVVELFFRAKGAKSFTYKGFGRTTSTGSFSIPVKATRDGYWSAVWFTRSTSYVNADSAEDYVDVR